MSDREPLEEYTREEFTLAFGKSIRDHLAPPEVHPTEDKRAVLLGGQSGAGKTTLHAVFRRKFKNNVIVINGDAYRSLHPRFREIQSAYGKDAAAHTAKWAGRMTEGLVDALSKRGYNLIIEGTLRTSQVPLDTARLLRDRGYSVSLALMAVKPAISLVSCQIRYEEMKAAGTTPRATDPAHHNAIVRDIADNLAVLEESGLFSAVYVYDRAQRCLYPAEGAPGKASDALRRVLYGLWTQEEEEHRAFLERRLADLTAGQGEVV